jgi:hypothetical protein
MFYSFYPLPGGMGEVYRYYVQLSRRAKARYLFHGCFKRRTLFTKAWQCEVIGLDGELIVSLKVAPKRSKSFVGHLDMPTTP